MRLPDGFLAIGEDELRDPARNVAYVVDEFSPFCDPAMLSRSGDGLIADRYYGQVYRTLVLQPAAIYGKAESLPAYSGDQLGNDGFLRVPFRRIPRRVVRSRRELEALLGSFRSADDNLRVLLRGQSREHLIGRSEETTQWLYGEDRVKEPSLQTSSARRSPALENVLPEWCAVVKLFLETLGDAYSGRDRDFTTNGVFPLFALALAQHYGLPTAGLDVTDRLDVALFFALMAYDKPMGGVTATYTRQAQFDAMPVIYVLAPAERQQFNFEQLRMSCFPQGRPDAQSAHFMHVGWGHATNACAQRIFLALYLDPTGDFGTLPTPAQLFPADHTDLFAQFLKTICERRPGGDLGRAFNEGFYVIAPG
jgi:hypothetical protein